MEDVLTKATADGVRIYALCTTNLVQEAAQKARLLPSGKRCSGTCDERRAAAGRNNEG